MFSPEDTIVAVATPPGRGGIGVVRISGPRAGEIGSLLLNRREPLEPRRATFVRVQRRPDEPPELRRRRSIAPRAQAAIAHMASGAADRSARVRSGRLRTPVDDLALHTRARDGQAVRSLDEAIATWFPAPHSYTGQDVLEISAHGSPVVLHAIVRSAMNAGARLAQPGEFTLRAFLNGKRDLVQAEAVGDLIAAVTPLQARVAFDQLEGTLTRSIAEIDAALFDLIARLEASLDFPEEGYRFVEPEEVSRAVNALIHRVGTLLGDATRGRMIREGATAVIAGRPNVGKSSVFNALAGIDRAIVTPVAGTTRDLVTERVDLDGLPVTLVDTAGSRDTDDLVEREGVTRGARARDIADVVLLVLDGSEPLTVEDERLLARTNGARRVIVVNKRDLAPAWDAALARPNSPDRSIGDSPVLRVSAVTGEGIIDLRQAVGCQLTGGELLRDTAAISNVRHINLLEKARTHLGVAYEAAKTGTMPEEFLLIDLQAARAQFEEVIGRRTTEDVLRHIFEKFCIGK